MQLLRRTVPVLALVVLGTGAGCTAEATRDVGPRVSPATGAAIPDASAATPAAPLVLPTVAAGELARVVLSGIRHEVTVRRPASRGVEYALRAECTSDIAGRILSYELRDSTRQAADTGDILSSGQFPCNGTVTVNSAPLPAVPVTINLGTDGAGLTDVVAAYAILTPLT